MLLSPTNNTLNLVPLHQKKASPVQDVRVRQALNHAFDRETFVMTAQIVTALGELKDTMESPARPFSRAQAGAIQLPQDWGSAPPSAAPHLPPLKTFAKGRPFLPS